MRGEYHPVVVHPPGPKGRRVTVDGVQAGYALSRMDVLWMLWEAGYEPDDIELDDTELVDWRGGGPDAWDGPPGVAAAG
ncbi:hypothetical protein K7472_31110 [Streptomyces sp. PTM05]|uniref:Transcriptional regulator n=1 Tax=Streptantibioticus parmotrematis TaxID=2873249 RepID=A0ABS7R405_9ACTN|nr:hypothetical protein [Streptantibioticus parmotrematis]MBY8889260.1 hypothetical protein [Streptantibioticus parmotrematis]